MSERAPNELQIERRPSVDLGVWIVAIVLAGSGYAYAKQTEPSARRVFAFERSVSVQLPAGWSGHEEDDRFVAQLPGLDGVPPTVLVEPVEVPSDPEAAAMFHDLELTRMQEARARSGVGFRVLHVDERSGDDGSASTWVWYAIVREPPGSSPGDAVIPVIVHGVDVLVTTRSGRAWHVGAFEPLHGSDDDERNLRAVVEGVRFAE